jgi:hypothetical protein
MQLNPYDMNETNYKETQTLARRLELTCKGVDIGQRSLPLWGGNLLGRGVCNCILINPYIFTLENLAS